MYYEINVSKDCTRNLRKAIIMYYEINVSKDCKHVFATAPRSLSSRDQAEALYALLKQKLPDHAINLYEIVTTYRTLK